MPRPEAFVLIERDEAAHRLLLTWPSLPRWPAPLVQAVREAGTGERTRLVPDHHRRLADWARLAGVAVADAYRCEAVLLGNELCRADGQVDESAVQLIRTGLARRLGRTPRTPAAPRPGPTG